MHVWADGNNLYIPVDEKLQQVARGISLCGHFLQVSAEGMRGIGLGDDFQLCHLSYYHQLV